MQLAVNLAWQTQGHGHLMRQDQPRPGNKRLFRSLDLEIENLLRQERTLLYSFRHSRTSWQFSFARRIQHYHDSGYFADISIAGLGTNYLIEVSPAPVLSCRLEGELYVKYRQRRYHNGHRGYCRRHGQVLRTAWSQPLGRRRGPEDHFVRAEDHRGRDRERVEGLLHR